MKQKTKCYTKKIITSFSLGHCYKVCLCVYVCVVCVCVCGCGVCVCEREKERERENARGRERYPSALLKTVLRVLAHIVGHKNYLKYNCL